jgi:hypothetical protein
MLARLSYLMNKVDEFWFARDVRLNLRVLQDLWAALVLLDIFSLWLPAFEFLFRKPGIFREATDPQFLHWWNLFAYFDNDFIIETSLVVLIASLALLILGVRRKRSALLSLYLLICFHHISPHILIPYYDLMRFTGFCLIFVNFNLPFSNLWILRLIQLQFSVVYIASALYKILSWSWLSGEASLLILQIDDSTGTLVKSFMASHQLWPIAFRAVSWLILATESFIGIGIWIPRTRRMALLTAVIYHFILMMLFTTNSFQWIMLFGLAAFVNWSAIELMIRKPTDVELAPLRESQPST